MRLPPQRLRSSNLCVQEGLCGEKHRYLPSEVILGRPNELAAKKQRA